MVSVWGKSRLLEKLRRFKLLFLAGMYILAFLVVERVVENPIRHYNFCVFLSLSGIYFSWVIGGKRAMCYVAFFNLFFVFIFSKLLWVQGIIVYGSRLFVGRSFLVMYGFAFLLLFLMLFKKSPADALMEKQKQAVDESRQKQQNLEFMVASRKLKQDLLAQANLVKDELQLLEGAWQSKIHDIINDFPTVKERELYQKIILPFQDNVIQKLRDLELCLTFDLEPSPLPELLDLLTWNIKNKIRAAASGTEVEIRDNGWQGSSRSILADRNKIWDMVLNVLRNSQAALDLKRIEMLRQGMTGGFKPRICVAFLQTEAGAELCIVDNGGGVSCDQAPLLYKEPVPSRKRGGKRLGQGTLFVKFFAERMGMQVTAANTQELGDAGLAVRIQSPFSRGL